MPNRPKATALKILEGNPGRRKLTKNEPQPDAGIPEMPEWLKNYPRAVEEWERESRILDDMGLMTVAEATLLANRVYMMAEIERMAEHLRENGDTVRIVRMDTLGNEIIEIRKHPYVDVRLRLLTEYRHHGSLLGLDAPSRTKLSVDPSRVKKSKWAGKTWQKGS